MGNFSRGAAALLFVVLTTAACRTGRTDERPVIVQPGAPGQATRVIRADKAADLSQVQHTAADIKFMQGMIGHHAQAIEMTALIPSRTQREDMKMLGLRISLSQEDEIKMMRQWLEARGVSVQFRHRKGDAIDAACGQLRRRLSVEGQESRAGIVGA